MKDKLTELTKNWLYDNQLHLRVWDNAEILSSQIRSLIAKELPKEESIGINIHNNTDEFTLGRNSMLKDIKHKLGVRDGH